MIIVRLLWEEVLSYLLLICVLGLLSEAIYVACLKEQDAELDRGQELACCIRFIFLCSWVFTKVQKTLLYPEKFDFLIWKHPAFLKYLHRIQEWLRLAGASEFMFKYKCCVQDQALTYIKCIKVLHLNVTRQHAYWIVFLFFLYCCNVHSCIHIC